MKENIKLITVLNKILVDELSDINQNIFHSKKSGSQTDKVLFEEIAKETSEQLKQAEWLVKRIMFLEVLKTRQYTIGANQKNKHKAYEKSRNVG